jgi:hypothetical protein
MRKFPMQGSYERLLIRREPRAARLVPALVPQVVQGS